MNRKQLLEIFLPSFLSDFQQRLFIALLHKLPIQQESQKLIIQFKAINILNEIEEKISYQGLQEEMKAFLQKTYTIETSKKLIQTNIISKSSFIKGKGIIELQINPILLPYLQSLKRHFSLSTLRAIFQFKSVYSINIYLLLVEKNNGYRLSYSLSQLKNLLDIEGKYKDYNTFKNRIILQAQKELHLTNRAFLYEEEKEGRKVTHIIFKIYPLNQLYWTNNKKYLVQKLIKDLSISELQASQIVFQFVKEEIYNIIYEIKEKERAGLIKTSLGAFSVSFFSQKNKNKA